MSPLTSQRAFTEPAPQAHQVQLRLLGGLRVVGNDGLAVPALAAQPRRAALLVTLALARRGEPWRREALVDLLWPEMTTERGRAALRRALSHLRTLLGPSVFLTHGDDLVALNPSEVWCDVWALLDGLGERRAATVLDLYAGDLLSGMHIGDAPEWEAWIDRERAGLRRKAREAAGALARDAATDRDGPNAARWARLAASIDPDDEETHRLHLSALLIAGDPAAAVNEFEGWSARRRAELELEPSAATLDVATRARSAMSARAVDLDATPALPSRERPTAPPLTIESSNETLNAVSVEPPAPRRWRSRRTLALGGMAAVLIALTIWARPGAGRRSGNAAPPPASGWPTVAERTPVLDGPPRMAIFPFVVRGDRSLQYLSEGVAELLSVPLDGTGVLRVVDRRALTTASSPAAGLSLDSARAIAIRSGAQHFVLGSVVAAAGQRLALVATVYDAEGTVQGRASSAAVPEGELFSAVDTLAHQLVGLTVGERAGRFGQLAALTTASLPALRSYLDGERAFAAGHFDVAASRFAEAVAVDTSFALAYFRLGLAIDWGGALRQDWTREAAAEHALAHAAQLPVRERELLAAYTERASARSAEADARFRRLTAAYPDGVEGWHEWGELRFHSGHELQEPMRSARPMFERVIALDSSNVSAHLHLARIAALEGQRAEFDSLFDWVARRVPGHEALPELRLVRAVLTRDASGLAALSAAHVRATPPLDMGAHNALFVNAWRAALLGGDPGAGLAIWTGVDTPAHPQDARLTARLARAHAEAGRGRWAAVDSTLTSAAALDAASADEVRAGLAVFAGAPATFARGTLAGGGVARAPGTFAQATDVPALQAAAALRSVIEPVLRGMLAARAGRLPEARAQVALAQRAYPALRPDMRAYGEALSLELEAAVADASGDAAGAVRLGQRSWRVTPRVPSMFAYPLPARLLLRAEWARRSGDRAGALRWCDAADVDIGLGDGLAPAVARCRAGQSPFGAR